MKIKSFLLLILIVVSSVAVAVVGCMYYNTTYSNYAKNLLDTTMEEAVLKGAAHNVFPWTKVETTKNEVVKKKKSVNTPQKPIEKRKEFVAVDDSYFDDALFIGDSRMVGLSQYCEPIYSRATFYAKKSLSIYNIRDDQWIEKEDGAEISLFEALENEQYSKIYIMVGINELGTGDEWEFQDAYATVINRILEIEPDANIFINSIMHVTEEKGADDLIYNNTNINIRNETLAALADNQRIFYINVNEAVDDENGNLNAETTTDGVHLKAAYYELLHQYYLLHGIED